VDTQREVDTMARMSEEKKPRRPRRTFTAEFKAGVVGLVLDQGKSISEVSRDLDISPSCVGEWVERARADRSGGKTGLTTTEREELARLRRENAQLKMEREILKKAAAFFAKENA
jgi:transposase